MRFFLTTLILFLIGINLLAQHTAKRVRDIGYLEYLPPGYDNNSNEKFPVMIFLHGAGEKGDGSPSSLFNNVAKLGPPKHIENGNDMCFNVNGSQECFIVISPQLESGHWSPNIVDEVLDHVLNGSENYKVDRSRVYLTGLSLGGGGTWSHAYSNYNEPNKLAAIAPIAAWGSTNKGYIISERKIAVWGFHGDGDNVVSYDAGLAMFNSVKNCNDPSPSRPTRFTTYPNVGHNSWSRAYSTDHSIHSPNVYEWLLKQTLSGSTSPPAPPIADAGDDIVVDLPQNTLTLDGSGSSGSGAVSYRWTQVDGPSVHLNNANSATAQVEGLDAGTYAFKLTVTDAQSNKDSDQVQIVVIPATVEAPDSWLEITSENVGGKVLALYYNSQKSDAITQPVRITGNDHITFSLKHISGNPDWSRMELHLTVSYQTRSVNLGDYITQVSSDWTEVSIPLDAFGHDADRWNSGVSNFQLKMLSGFGENVFGLDEIKYTGGSNEFVWYGDTYTNSGASNAVYDAPELFISGRRTGSVDDGNSSPIAEGNWLKINTEDAGGKSLILYHNAQKSTGVNVPVRTSGNNTLRFLLKNISGNPNWTNMEVHLTVSYQRRSVVIADYVSQVGADWAEVVIPLNDFNHDADRWEAGVSTFELKMRGGFGAAVFGLDEIKYTGGSEEYVWYGDTHPETASQNNVEECPEFYISERMTGNSVPASTGNWLELTTLSAGGKTLALYHNEQKNDGVRIPVKASGNDKISFLIKTISGAPDWSQMEVHLTVSYQTRSVVIADYVNQVGTEWTEVVIPLNHFGHDADRWYAGVSNFQLKMRAGFGAAVFGLDEVKYKGGTEEYVWYGDDYEASGAENAVIECPEFYVSNRVTNTSNSSYTASEGSASWLEATTTDRGGKVLALYHDSRKDDGVKIPVRDSGNDKLRFLLKRISGSPNWRDMEVHLTVSYQTEAVVIADYVNEVGDDWTEVVIPLSDFDHYSERWDLGVSNFQLKMKTGFGAAVFGIDEIKYTGGTEEYVWYGDAYELSGAAEAVIESPDFYISNRDGESTTYAKNSSIQNSTTENMSIAIEDTGDRQEKKVVIVFDLNGKKVLESTTREEEKGPLVSGLGLQAGFYVIHVITGSRKREAFKVRVD